MDENLTSQQSQSGSTSTGALPPTGSFIPPQNAQNSAVGGSNMPIPNQQQGNPLPQPDPVSLQSAGEQNQVHSPSTMNQVNDSSPRITIDDLYGPSQPGELPQAVQQSGATIDQNQEQQSSFPPPPPSLVEPTQSTPVLVEPSVSQQESSVARPVIPMQSPEEAAPASQAESPEIPTEPQRRSTINEGITSAYALSDTQSASASTNMGSSTENTKKGGGSSFHITGLLRLLIGGVLALIVLFVIIGIGSLIFSTRGTNGSATLTYWGLWEDSQVMQPILDEFHKEHPSITVNYVKEDPNDYTQRLLTRIQEGDGPDIFTFHNSWVYPLQNVLAPLPTSVIDAKTMSNDYPAVVSSDMVTNGAVYGLPLQMDALSLFVNTDIFNHAGAKVPTTWDNFITVAKALTVKDPNGQIQTAGAAMGTYNNISHAPDILSLLLLQNGANLQKLNNSTNATDALTFYTSFAQGDGSVWDNTLDNSLLAFERGKLAMYFGYSYDIFAIQAANPTLHFSIYPVPHLPGRNMTIASYWATGVSSKSKNQQAAYQFMQYLAQKDTQSNLYTEETKTREFGELYPRIDLAQGLTGNPLLAPIINQFSSAVSSFFVDSTDYTEYNGALNQYLGNAVNSMLQNTSADSAIATLAQGVDQVLSTYAQKTQQ